MIVFAIGLFAVPQAFADVTVENKAGSSTPGCEETDSCFIPNPVTIAVGETVTWANTDTAAHTATGGTPDAGLSGIFDSSLIMAGDHIHLHLILQEHILTIVWFIHGCQEL